MEGIATKNYWLTFEVAQMNVYFDLELAYNFTFIINQTYKKGDVIRWESPFMSLPTGFSGLWTFSIIMRGIN